MGDKEPRGCGPAKQRTWTALGCSQALGQKFGWTASFPCASSKVGQEEPSSGLGSYGSQPLSVGRGLFLCSTGQDPHSKVAIWALSFQLGVVPGFRSHW